jgi:FAD/FMN-containing dehydrogenase
VGPWDTTRRASRAFSTLVAPSGTRLRVLVTESADDVVEGVRLARNRGWKVAIRAGGHSFPTWSLREDGLVMDLGGFKETAFDESTGIVSVTPSVTCGELNAYLSGYGRFVATADCPTVGLGGFLLQGGVGMGFRGWGYAAEQIASIEVVTADGELVRADEQNNSDLFWAARGAGPGFCGAITRFHLKTRPVPAGLAATTHIYPLVRYAEVVEWVWKIHHSLSPNVALVAVSVIPPFPVPGTDEGFMFIVAGVALSSRAHRCNRFKEIPRRRACRDRNRRLDERRRPYRGRLLQTLQFARRASG